MKTLVIGALLLLCPAIAAAQISVTIQRPLAGALVGDSFSLAATVTSVDTIQDVTASVRGRTIPMTFSTCAYRTGNTCNPGWVTPVTASGFPRGDLLIAVTARDVSSQTAMDSRHVRFDRPPVLTVTSPLQFAVGRPLVHVVASCLDDDPSGCASITVSDCPTPAHGSRVIGGSVVDVWVSPCNDSSLGVTVTGTDSAGQQGGVTVGQMSTLSAPLLRSLATVDGLIVDARDTRVLYEHRLNPNDAEHSELWVRDFVSGGPDTRVPVPPGYDVPLREEFLTPHGAIFVSHQAASSSSSRLFEWRDGTLVDLGPYGAYMGHSDTFAAWVSDGIEQQHLVLRDLQAGTNTDTTVATGVVNLDVAGNGDVVFTSRGQSSAISRYRDGVVTPLTTGLFPMTDGLNMTFVQAENGSSATWLFDEAGERVLTTPATGPGLLNNGWIAYSNWIGVDQATERAPDGTTTTLTPFTASTVARALAPNGEVIIRTEANSAGTGGLYLAVPGMALRRITDSPNPNAAAPNIQPYYLNGRWYLTLGNTLFDILDTCELTVAPAGRSYGAPGGTGTFEIGANGDGCPWSTTGAPSWITVYYGASGAGTGIVRLGVAANAGAARSAMLTIAGHPVAIDQAAAGTLEHTRGDFTGDGRASRAVFRPYGGTWLIEGLLPLVWGQPSWTPVPADYDGDGITDLAVFAPESGIWSIRGQPMASWGVPGDIPVPADYDGDRRADVAVFRPALGRWFVNGQFADDLGLPGDVPLPADYDGDGRADLAVYRPSTGMWLVRGVGSTVWGQPGDIPVPADYNGDGLVDIAVYRPATSMWYVKDQFARQYGVAGDLPVPLDYDGDGRAELAVYRRATGTWYVENGGPGLVIGRAGDLPIGLPTQLIPHGPIDLDGDRRTDAAMYDAANDQWLVQHSITGFASRDGFSFGLASDVRRIADVDGDGRGDLVLMRPSTGMWYIALSTAGYNSYVSYGPWGTTGDTVVPADYDGDHKADLAVFRPGTGRWYIKTSSSGFVDSVTIDWGLPGDIAVPADYDGDRRADVAVFRPSLGRWYVKRSSDGSMIVVDWGLASDLPVPADYDGDGRADVAIFRPSTGEWWIRDSSTNFTTWSTVVFGANGDVPIPGDYNGDGFAEPAYFRPDAGFFIAGFGQVSAAASGDQAIRDR